MHQPRGGHRPPFILSDSPPSDVAEIPTTVPFLNLTIGIS